MKIGGWMAACILDALDEWDAAVGPKELESNEVGLNAGRWGRLRQQLVDAADDGGNIDGIDMNAPLIILCVLCENAPASVDEMVCPPCAASIKEALVHDDGAGPADVNTTIHILEERDMNSDN